MTAEGEECLRSTRAIKRMDRCTPSSTRLSPLAIVCAMTVSSAGSSSAHCARYPRRTCEEAGGRRRPSGGGLGLGVGAGMEPSMGAGIGANVDVDVELGVAMELGDDGAEDGKDDADVDVDVDINATVDVAVDDDRVSGCFEYCC